MKHTVWDSGTFLVALLALHLACIGLFTWGFFLTKYQVTNVSSCSSVPPLLQGSPHVPSGAPLDGHGCWMPLRYRKVILLVVDALRFDFVLPQPHIPPNRWNPNFHGHLPVVRRLLRDAPERSLLYRFDADPPTVTMQRLKGLTTGGLPTFLEVSTNFDSFAIWEDNLVHQLVRHNRTVVFMGDDTWDNLFPDTFARSYPFPSFNVKDLHTVDNGVLSHLFPELNGRGIHANSSKDAADWNVLIAHFLGVDHVGHRYGPDHPEMASKLDQMNEMLENVVENMDDDTLLVFLGDHGMTAEGNHGGASPMETGSALFFHSKKPLVDVRDGGVSSSHPREMPRQVEQIDLVPTLALLCGVPIPFGSLGFPIPEMFSRLPIGGSASGEDVLDVLSQFGFGKSNEEDLSMTTSSSSTMDSMSPERCVELLDRLMGVNEAFFATAAQLHHYTRTYGNVSTEFSPSVLEHLEAPLRHAMVVYQSVMDKMGGGGDDDRSLLDVVRSLTGAQRKSLVLDHVAIYRQLDEYQNGVLMACKRLWTTFDLPLMRWAVALLLVVVGGIQVPALVFLSNRLPPPRSIISSGAMAALIAAVLALVCAPALRMVCFDQGALGIMMALAMGTLAFVGTYVVKSLIPSGAGGGGDGSIPSMLHRQTARGATTEPVWYFTAWVRRVMGDPSSLGPMNVPAVLAVGLIMLHGAGLFSNSFLEAQGPALLFLGQTMVLGTGLYGFALGMGKGALQALVIAGVSRLSKEAAEYVNRSGEVAINTFIDVALLARVAAPLCVIAMVWYWWLRKTYRSAIYPPSSSSSTSSATSRKHVDDSPPLHLTRFGSTVLFFLIPFVAMCVGAFWALQTQSNSDVSYRALSLLFPWGVYLSVLITLIRLLWDPVLVVCANSSSKSDAIPSSIDCTVAHFRLMMSVLAALCLGAICLVLGVRASWVVACLSVQLLLWLDFSWNMQQRVQLLSSARKGREDGDASAGDTHHRLLPVRVADCCVWGFFTLWYFYASGHVCSFGALHIEAAFVGFEKFYFLPGGFLLLLDTYGPGHGMGLLLLPLLIAVATVPRGGSSSTSSTMASRGEEFVRRVTQALVGYQFLFSFQFACTVVFVYFARRHLMVWRLFAPQYIFDMTQLIVVDVLTVLVFALTMRWAAYAYGNGKKDGEKRS